MANEYNLVSKDLAEFKGLKFVEDFLDEQNAKGVFVKDEKLFVAMVMWAFFFYNSINNSDEFKEKIWQNIVDGANDTGIDFICIYEDVDDKKHLAIGQVKYRSATPRPFEDIVDPFIKEIKGYKDYYQNKSNPNTSVDGAFRRADVELDGDDPEATEFWIFWAGERPKDIDKELSDAWDINKPKGQTFAKKNVRWDKEFANDGSSIHDKIEYNKHKNDPISKDSLAIDDSSNILRYHPWNPQNPLSASATAYEGFSNESPDLVVNVSADSLRTLYTTYKNRLLSLNLRYHIRDKKVDPSIDDTISKSPNDFWYLNNGITIVCDNYKLDEAQNIITLYNFSIINGGQTTNRIGSSSVGRPGDGYFDFYLPCKVIRLRGKDEEEKKNFADRVAKATNLQKAINPWDLRANSQEQRILQSEAKKLSYFYAPKNGEENNTPFKLAIRLKPAATILASGILQLPGTARSGVSKLAEDEYYNQIFNPQAIPNTNSSYESVQRALLSYADPGNSYISQVASLLKDFVWINNCYKKEATNSNSKKASNSFFGKHNIESDEEFDEVIKNGRTLILALSGLCSRIKQFSLNVSYYKNKNKSDYADFAAYLEPKWTRVFPNLCQENEGQYKDRFIEFAYKGLMIIQEECSNYGAAKSRKTAVSNIMKNDDFYYYILKRRARAILDLADDFKDLFV